MFEKLKIHALSIIANFILKNLTGHENLCTGQFNYCPFIWMPRTKVLNNKVNSLHEISSRTVYHDKKIIYLFNKF